MTTLFSALLLQQPSQQQHSSHRSPLALSSVSETDEAPITKSRGELPTAASIKLPGKINPPDREAANQGYLRRRRRRYKIVEGELVEEKASGKVNREGLISPLRRRSDLGKTAAQVSVILSLGMFGAIEKSTASSVFINEFHYDNNGTDIAEGFEIAAAAGTSLNGWQLLFYNGSDGGIYRQSELDGLIPDSGGGFGVLNFSVSGIQNGPADGFALINENAEVLEFISYEGSLVATEGPAQGLTSIDVGLSEAADALVGMSIQRYGAGRQSQDFSWQIGEASFGDINEGQTFSSPNPVPLPASLWLFTSACAVLLQARRRRMTLKPD